MSFTVRHPSFPDVTRGGLDAARRDEHVKLGWVYDEPTPNPEPEPAEEKPAKGKPRKD